MKRSMVIVLAVVAVLGACSPQPSPTPEGEATQGMVIVQLDPMGGSGISGTATLIAAADGGARITIDLQGLVPGEDVAVNLNANTCAMPSASLSRLLQFEADASGKATASGEVLFRNEKVALATIADSGHIIRVLAGQGEACGVIPELLSP